MFSADDTSVRVALRVRPQLPREKIDMCRICTSVTPGEPHIMLGSDKAFTYDNVFDLNAKQESIYSECVSTLIEGCFDGYNATVLAYGQTGSGKTYTMGTGFDVSIAEQEELGIVPRAVHHLFDGIEQRRLQAIKHGEAPPEFKVHAEFLELYNEDIIDLFDPSRDDKPAQAVYNRQTGKVEVPGQENKLSKIKIHEDPAGGIYVAGVTSRLVTSENDTLDALKQGALSRTTASTQMNNMSSRSHAIFTLHIKQQRVCKNQLVRRRYRQRDTDADEDTTMESGQLPEFEALSAKFHFVDLAGSERLKRTGATGDRAKEGISINCGLLALGNVISALGDKAKKATHVPYRDSKLTRLLQDSLGGNSRTLMIACIAPCDRDFMETLNTLKYANRARNIKNKVVVNQDKTSKQIAALRVEIIALQNELMEYKTGKRQVDSEGLEHVNDMFNENTMMQAENNGLRVRIKAVQETVSALTQRNAMLLSDRTIGGWINHEDGETDEMASMIQNYIMEIEELRAKLLEAEASCDALRRREEMLARSPSRTPLSPFHMPSSSVMSGSYVDVDTISMSSSADLGTNILDEAKKELRQLKSKALNVSRQSSRASNEKDRDSYEDLSDQEIMETMGDSDNDNDNIAEEDEDDAGDEDSTDESDVEEEGMQEDLAELTSEINIKQKLIEELETNHRKMELLRHQYEEKLSQLHTRIRDTELERDQVLSNLNMKEKEANAKNIKEEYEKKLSSMQTEVKKLQAAKKEHDRLRQQQQRTERQLKFLQNELSEMKKAKVKLMTKLKEDAKRMAGREAEKSREIAGLRKTQRQRDNQIRTLEAEKKLKEVVLRRKQEELQSLKKNIMSDKVAGRVTRNRAVARPATRMQHVFNARVAHQKWTLLEKQISTITLKKQTLFNMEQDMDRWVKQREKLGKEMEMLTQKRDAAEQRHAEESITRDLSEQIDSVRANLDYVQDNISECQEQIVQLEDSKDLETGASGMSVNLSTLIENVRLEEAKYLLEHLFNAAVSKSMLAHQNESGYKELQAKIKQTEQNNAMHQQLLQYMLQERGELDVLTFLSNDGSGGDVSSGASSPSDSMMGVVPPLPGAQLLQVPKKDKARRKTATTEDLLYAGPRESQGSSVAPLLPVPSSYQAALEEELGEEEECSMPSKAFRESRLVTVLTSQEPSQGNRLGSRPESKTLPAAPVKDSSLMPPPKLPPPRPTSAANVRSTEPSPMLRRKISSSSQLTDPSPVMRRKNSFTLKSNSHSSSNLRGMSRQNSFNKKRNSANSINNLDSTGSTDDSPEPDSPPAQTRDQNVFSRLYSHAPSSSSRGEGVINPYTGKPPGNMPLYCTHQAEGHDKPVLSLTATETLLFSSSKDRSVKVWDMIVGREIMSFDGHPNNVVAVRYSPQTSLAFSASMYTIKVWDIRERPTKCLKTLSSSGMTTNGALATIEPNTRVVTQPSGESQINDIQLNESGTTLFSAATNTVRVWDLRKFMSIGKLSGGHQAAVMVMAMSTNDENGNVLVTGSKDHYIKVFGVPEYAAGVHTPKFSLDPPHYDGIQSLAIHGNSLFSGSRDTCIKKWDLAEKKLKFSMNQAHKDWVEALQLLPEQNCLLSGGRDGYLKVWNCDNCALVGEIRAHSSPINAIATNSSAIFTASNDQTIGVWKPRNNLSALVMDAGEDERIA